MFKVFGELGMSPYVGKCIRLQEPSLGSAELRNGSGRWNFVTRSVMSSSWEWNFDFQTGATAGCLELNPSDRH
ncbi:unnamed protein product [Phytophthora fragariaefolia]|uniref:Unnamed protein product n=1 Tax=Phytophthora fragariaefolia TaxID=1490495 RepID=A0A9W7D5C5_9STRA|nr:unnamed protein product [Phytophthora fragariaefolia]